MISFPDEGVKVTKVEKGIRKQGLFSPYTEFRNYFVFQSGFLPSVETEKEPLMILVNSLSQV